jgi:hypothetical protein
LKRRGFQLFFPRGVFVELRLNDLVEAAVDGRKSCIALPRPPISTYTPLI